MGNEGSVPLYSESWASVRVRGPFYRQLVSFEIYGKSRLVCVQNSV
jgi:hypothetical protein